MPWPVETLKSWQDLDRIVGWALEGTPLKIGYLHRGQSDASWPLTSSLARLIRPGLSAVNALELEADLLRIFKSQAHIHVRAEFLPPEDRILEWWQVMQHYGAPTRMIVWTASPFVAAYFAVVEHWDRDGAIWTVHPATLQRVADEALKQPVAEVVQSEMAPATVVPLPMLRNSDRTVAQQGAFTIAAHILGEQEALIETASAPRHKKSFVYTKFVVPKELKPQILKRLRIMNVSAAALFPGHDGLGRSLSELARLGSLG